MSDFKPPEADDAVMLSIGEVLLSSIVSAMCKMIFEMYGRKQRDCAEATGEDVCMGIRNSVRAFYDGKNGGYIRVNEAGDLEPIETYVKRLDGQ